MIKIDFCDFNENQIETAKIRIDAIKLYDAMEHRSNEDVAELAASIGLSIWRFRKLVRVWHAYKDVRLIVLNDGKKKGGRRLSPKVLLIIHDEIRDPENKHDIKKITHRVQTKCREEGLQVPVGPTILRAIRAHQASSPEAFNPNPRIAVGRMWIRLPTLHENDGTITTNPCLLAAIALPEARLLTYQVTFDQSNPASVGDLLRSLVAQNDDKGKIRPVYIHPTDYSVAKDVIEELGLEKTGIIQNKKSFDTDRCYVGSLDCFPVLNRPAPKSLRNSEVLKRHGNYQSPEESLREIERAVTLHNASHILNVPIKLAK